MTRLEIKLKNKIMRRVYATWFLKKVFSTAFLRLLITLTMFIELAREVSVANVINNLPDITNLSANYRYFSFAFAHTEFSVQFYLLGITVMALWFAIRVLSRLIPNFGIRGSNI